MKLDPIPYASPIVHYDPVARILVIEDRNSTTGCVVGQTPSAATVRQADVAALGGGSLPSALAGAAPAGAGSAGAASTGTAASTAGVSLVI